MKIRAVEAPEFPTKDTGGNAIGSLEIVIAAFLIAIGIYGTLTAKAPPGDPINLTFTATDGSTVDLAALRAKVVLLDFWATWCAPCRGEVPNVDVAYNKYHAQGFEVVGISLDQDRDSLSRFTTDNAMTWPQFFEGQVAALMRTP